MIVAETMALAAAAMVPAVAVKLALEAPAATATDGGTVRSGLLLERVTDAPLAGASPERTTIQVDDCPEPKLAGEQVKPLTWTGGSRITTKVCELPL